MDVELNHRLINYVKIHPMLYDRSCRAYGNNKLKAKTWIEIAQALGTTDKQCKKRYRSLRDTFARCLKEARNGDAGKPFWVHFDQMLFLADHIGQRSAYDGEEVTETTKEETSEEFTITLSPFERQSPEREVTFVDLKSEEAPKRRRLLIDEEEEDDTSEVFGEELRVGVSVDDEMDAFMKFLGAKVKRAKLSNNQILQFQMDTLKFIAEKLEELNRKQ